MKHYLQVALAVASFNALAATAAIPSGYTVTPGNNATVQTLSVITIAKSNSFYHEVYVTPRSITVNGEEIAVTQKAINGDRAVEITLSRPVDQSGTYLVEVPARMFTWDMSGDQDNPAMSWTVIVDNPDKPIIPDVPEIEVTASPESGATVPSLDMVTVTFGGADAVALSDACECVATVSFSGVVMDNAITFSNPVGASIDMTVATPLTESGAYTFTIPAGMMSLTIGDKTVESPEVKLHYTVKAPLKDGDFFTVDKLRYKIISVEEGTVALTFPDFKNGGSEADYAHLTTIETSVTFEGVDYTVTEIGDLALSEVNGIKDFVVPEGIVRIGMAAFWDSSLETISIPASVTEIGESCFEECEQLKEFTLPATVTTIGSDMFYGCVQMKTISLPEGMTEIPGRFLEGCAALTSVTIPSTVTKIGEFALSECELLSETALPEGVTYIDKFAFAYTPALQTLPIPEGVTFMGHGVFYQSGLIESSLPEALTVIPDGTYQCCVNLQEFVVGNNVVEIEKEAFFWCFGLKSITFGEKVATFGTNVFLKDEAIETVTCLNPVPATGVTFEQTVYDNATLTVPNGCIEAYKAADGWKEFKNIKAADGSGVEDMAAEAAYTVAGNTITLNAPGVVIDAAGKVVLKGTGSVTLDGGVYIIKTPAKTAKLRL